MSVLHFLTNAIQPDAFTRIDKAAKAHGLALHAEVRWWLSNLLNNNSASYNRRTVLVQKLYRRLIIKFAIPQDFKPRGIQRRRADETHPGTL